MRTAPVDYRAAWISKTFFVGVNGFQVSVHRKICDTDLKMLQYYRLLIREILGENAMLHTENQEIREMLFDGQFGLEEESLRVTEEGFLADTPHPFPDDPHIVRDFSEGQVEINTPVADSPRQALNYLLDSYQKIQQKLAAMPKRELLWPFSNPPYIRRESDIQIAQFTGAEIGNTKYREYLSDRYGRYKMTFSGIHVNYSFSDRLLKKNAEIDHAYNYRKYKDAFYLDFSEKAALYGWLLVALTSASPIMDSSYYEKGVFGKDEFGGMGSVRCSELGYWNSFTPVFNYSGLQAYVDSIQAAVDEGFLAAARELYYPIRLKPAGKYNLESLRMEGVNHIEMRMFDLNPFAFGGIDIRDIRFTQLFLIWLSSLRRNHVTKRDQVEAAQNFKNAAHYDLKTVKIRLRDGNMYPVADAGLEILQRMQEFYRGCDSWVQDVLLFETAKFENADNRYAWQFRRLYPDHFVKRGLALADALQKMCL